MSTQIKRDQRVLYYQSGSTVAIPATAYADEGSITQEGVTFSGITRVMRDDGFEEANVAVGQGVAIGAGAPTGHYCILGPREPIWTTEVQTTDATAVDIATIVPEDGKTTAYVIRVIGANASSSAVYDFVSTLERSGATVSERAREALSTRAASGASSAAWGGPSVATRSGSAAVRGQGRVGETITWSARIEKLLEVAS